jgi:tRNA nucleotidyltransferase (CCA-adding enzyme)
MNIDVSKIPLAVKEVARRVASSGGKALLVGGSVIDLIQGREPKDYDLEVFGKGYSELETLFHDMNPKTVGASFGILKIFPAEGVDVDLNIPRTDNKVGVGHSDFEVIVDPNMSVREAARRRDFTINTLAVDVVTGKLHDEWGGLADLHNGILRATDPVLFVQDPVRPLRAMQLLARKARVVHPDTMQLIRGMHSEFGNIAKERVLEEWRKLLLKAPRPSVGLEFLWESGWVSHFPEISVLKGVPQKEDWHPEGDVWTHSLLAADAAAEIKGNIPEHQREAFVFGAFLHDVGKAVSTVLPEHVAAGTHSPDLLLTARGHDLTGGPIAESFMKSMKAGKKTTKLVRTIVEQHMQGYNLRQGSARKAAYVRLQNKMAAGGGDLHLLAHQCMCDACATSSDWRTRSLATGTPNWEHETSQRMLSMYSDILADGARAQPMVKGRDLMALGLKPGKQFGILTKKAYDLQLDLGLTSVEDIIDALRKEMPDYFPE